MKIRYNSSYPFLKEFIDGIPVLFEREGKTIYKARNELKVFDVAGMQLNVKRYKRPIFLQRIVYSFLRKTKARRAFENALKVRSLGFETPMPVAYLESRKNGLIDIAYFVSIQCPYSRLFREFERKVALEDHERIALEFGRHVARMHQSGIYHKDLSVGNVLFECRNDSISFSIVDINRMRFCPVGPRMGCRNFERLRGSEEFFGWMAKGYAEVRQLDEATCLQWILLYERKNERYFTQKYRRREIRKNRKEKRKSAGGSIA